MRIEEFFMQYTKPVARALAPAGLRSGRKNLASAAHSSGSKLPRHRDRRNPELASPQERRGFRGLGLLGRWHVITRTEATTQRRHQFGMRTQPRGLHLLLHLLLLEQ